MGSRQPDGDAAPHDGALPAGALARLGAPDPTVPAGRRAFGFYVHVPFCARRCGYCDFVTYTASELGGRSLQDGYAAAAVAEVRLAARVLGAVGGADGRAAPTVDTVFFGGGTPTLLPAADLLALLDAVRSSFALASGAEVTVEANPDSVDPALLATLAAGGVTRVSFGMQSVAPHVLAVLERTHRPEAVGAAVAAAHDAGIAHVNVDLIYGTPGETAADWAATLDAALATGADHVSAYALTVEPRTRLAAQVRQGRVPRPDEGALADRYAEADRRLTRAGLRWYELSNWAATPGARCRHNLGYWRNHDWWGVGPGAHSHVGGVRWWNVVHPAEHATRVRDGRSPALRREVLDDDQQRLEDVLLRTRLAEGLPVAVLDDAGRRGVDALVAEGLVELAGGDGDGARAGARVVLTFAGRQLADHVISRLVG